MGWRIKEEKIFAFFDDGAEPSPIFVSGSSISDMICIEQDGKTVFMDMDQISSLMELLKNKGIL